jgi:serine/threonine protein kinase
LFSIEDNVQEAPGVGKNCRGTVYWGYAFMSMMRGAGGGPDYNNRRTQMYGFVGKPCPVSAGFCDPSHDIVTPLVAMHGDQLRGFGDLTKSVFPDTGRPMFTGCPDKNATVFFDPHFIAAYPRHGHPRHPNATRTYTYEEEYGRSPQWWREADLNEIETQWTPARKELCTLPNVICSISPYYIEIRDTLHDDFYPGHGYPSTQDASPFRGVSEVWVATRNGIAGGKLLTVITVALGAKFHSDLETLFFWGSGIQTVEPGWAKHLTNLRAFAVYQAALDAFNYRPYLEGATFLLTSISGVSPTLRKLNRFDLTGANNTRGQGLPLHRMWYVVGNRASEFEQDACCETMPSTRIISLSQQFVLASLPVRMFRGLSELTHVRGDHNNITNLAADLFKDTTRLIAFTFVENAIAEIQSNALPAETIEIGDFALGANPSTCFYGVNLLNGRSEESLTCDCADGFIRGPTGKDTCVPVTCSSSIPVPDRNAGRAESNCIDTVVGALCTITCTLSQETAEYECGIDGTWGGRTTTLDCRDVLAPIAMYGLVGEPIEFPIPVTTTEIVWDPGNSWSDSLPHYGKDQVERTGGVVASYDIVVKCIQPPSSARSTIQMIGNSTLQVTFNPLPDRDEESCNYDFAQLEQGTNGYVVYGDALTRGMFRLMQGDNTTFYDQKVLFYASPLKTSVLHLTDVDVYATADGPEVLLHTSQTRIDDDLTNAQVAQAVIPMSPVNILPYGGFGAQTVFVSRHSFSQVGLDFDETTGIISGVPKYSGEKEFDMFDVDVEVTAQKIDNPEFTWEASRKQAAKFTLNISPPIKETGQSGFKATVRSKYAGSIPAVEGGRKPLHFSYYRNASSADLPAGLQVNFATGQITGVPTTITDGEVTMAILVTDANGATKTLQTVGLTIVDAITVTWTNAPPASVVGKTYPLNMDLGLKEIGLTELVYRLEEGSTLPPGLNLDCGGQIYGIATTSGNYTINVTVSDSDGSQAQLSVNNQPVQIIIEACTDDFTCNAHGTCATDDDEAGISVFDRNYTCECAHGWDGAECDIAVLAAASSAAEMSQTTIGELSSGVVAGVFLVVLAGWIGRRQLKIRSVKKRIAQLETIAFSDAESIDTATLDGVLFEAIELKCFALIPDLVIRGADASTRDHEMQLPITRLLVRKTGDSSSAAARKAAAARSTDAQQHALDDRTDAAYSLLSAHFEFDLTLGLAMVDGRFFESADSDNDGQLSFEECEHRGMSKQVFTEIDTDGNGTITAAEFNVWIAKVQYEKTPEEFREWTELQKRKKTNPLVQIAIGRMAESKWRAADGTTDSVAHRLLNACRERNLSEHQTVELLEVALQADPAILTVSNMKNQTPTELAMQCEGKLEIQKRFTVVLFNRYQIARPKNPLYKSPTAEVHECTDLVHLSNNEFNGTESNKRCVVKLMANPDLWMRELKTRDALGDRAAGSYVGAISAAIVEMKSSNPHDPHAYVASRDASEYASTSSSEVRPITSFAQSFVARTRREEARQLMNDYPYAIQMPLADRNLNEIIASERLAEEPLDVIRQSSRKVLNLIQDLHNEGVVHGDVKPKNVVRVDRTLMLIDLDMAITIGSPDAPAHANPEKFSGSTAYAAPELHRWMAEHEAKGFVADGTSPLDYFSSTQQIDLWSFAVTLYEMATGSPLFQNSYDRGTPAALSKLKEWHGLEAEQLSQIESLHGASESAALRDVLMWSLDAQVSSRPQSVTELTSHAFFDPRGGAMRENFVVNQIKQLLVTPPPNGIERVDVNVMVSYSWNDTDFVLSRLAVEVAPRVRELWLDRLGGEQGMGEFAQASMKRGVENADVVIAVVSPAYISSVNCGYEMALAASLGKPVIPIVLNVPFQEWPPQQIGQSTMTTQFATEAGDVKIFVDMSDPASFFQKFQQELLPRFNPDAGGFRSGATIPTLMPSPPPQGASNEVDADTLAALASDAAGENTSATPASSVNTLPRERPKKGKNKVAPAIAVTAPTFRSVIPEPPANPSAEDVRGVCGLCSAPVLANQPRDKDARTGMYYHIDCL